MDGHQALMPVQPGNCESIPRWMHRPPALEYTRLGVHNQGHFHAQPSSLQGAVLAVGPRCMSMYTSSVQPTPLSMRMDGAGSVPAYAGPGKVQVQEGTTEPSHQLWFECQRADSTEWLSREQMLQESARTTVRQQHHPVLTGLACEASLPRQCAT